MKKLENPLNRLKSDINFELKHKKYFIRLYINILVLCFLVAVAVYYKASIAVCADLGGYPQQDNESFYKIYCEPLPETQLISRNNEFNINFFDNFTILGNDSIIE